MFTRMSSSSGHSRGSQLLIEWRGEATQAQACELLDIDAASYNRFEHGIRKPSGEIMFRIERLTDGKVPAKSWYEPPAKIVGDKAAG
jgi:transcriptional regulator with XRE-family HTH domain